MIHNGRVHELTPNRKQVPGPVIYWMSRDQRADDNWAFLYALERAVSSGEALYVLFALSPGFLGATLRQYDFMLCGLEELEQRLKELNVPFVLRLGDPSVEVSAFVKESGAALLVTDFDPLRIKQEWVREVLKHTAIPVTEVDAHNVVPCRQAYPRAAFGAYVIRPSIRRLLGEYLIPIPEVMRYENNPAHPEVPVDWEQVRAFLEVDRTVVLPGGVQPGARAAGQILDDFLARGLERYTGERNNPLLSATSGLSPYLHFGQISAQRVALEVSASAPSPEASEAFLEELIVRRELADNFCFYQPAYDSTAGFPEWALKTLDEHRKDEREHLYTTKELEGGHTMDPLWNAAQKEMVHRGTMHGYLRMYWAKKILEWSRDPEEAMATAIRLNDRYQLDGRDPNGYTGIAWSIGGVHDRAWQERPVFGKIRYMNANGCRRKFDVDEYIRRIEKAVSKNAGK
ncbi:MAG: deoxyribodipyrimidine photo-lyase [Bacteroidota bacterium]